ncbi:RHS repeat domain-containing protein [Xenorhabdus bovienii]|uniref:RHS repeat domain-containing protein n=1 Tax=Xenorhabdus bovienii TaxID=40576 RepID=UPI0023B2E372|nr:RHS repeat domain-containing protein [Xenorhabdus bovienii]
MTVNRGDNLHQKTPEVTVLDNRGLTVRELRYHRHPNTPTTTDERITRHQFTLAGQLAHSIDPRLFDLQQTDNTVNPNMVYETALTGEVVRIRSVDAGNTLMLNDITGRPVLAINATEVTRTWQYEHETLPGRPLSITEQPADEAARITERFVWAGNTQAEKNSNLAGQCVRHYDTVGLNQTNSIALNGVPLSVTRQLLPDGTDADWQGNNESVWNDRLAPESFTTLSTADTTGALLTSTDAMGNVQRLAYDVAGLLTGSWLTLKNGTEQVIMKSLTYSAAGQKLREEHGNGVVTIYTYEPETQRLVGIKTERPPGHAQGAKVLQDLRYEYDPVGNVVKVTNDAEVTRFWRNQKVVPENTYVYDSLYQLVSATGREMGNIGQQGSNLPAVIVPLPADGSAYTNYTRTYSYDRGGNLTQMRHSAPATHNNYTTTLRVSDRSNRAVLSALTEDAAKVDGLFTAGGHQKNLLPGQVLTWTPRGELLKVVPVIREGASDDSERYRYDAASQRVMKVSTQKTANNTQTLRVVYLPGLELRTSTNGSTETENLQVITVGEAGRAQVRVLRWEAGKPADIVNDQVRYSYDNLIGSSGLEVDGYGNFISQEEYYPYGGTAVWTARRQTEADYKTIRYSGKERDATGLYYYGYRYYQPWVGRWLNPDPAGTVDGLNLFRMCRNNPITLSDSDGRQPVPGKYYADNNNIYNRFKAISQSAQAVEGNLLRSNQDIAFRAGINILTSAVAGPINFVLGSTVPAIAAAPALLQGIGGTIAGDVVNTVLQAAVGTDLSHTLDTDISLLSRANTRLEAVISHSGRVKDYTFALLTENSFPYAYTDTEGASNSGNFIEKNIKDATDLIYSRADYAQKAYHEAKNLLPQVDRLKEQALTRHSDLISSIAKKRDSRLEDSGVSLINKKRTLAEVIQKAEETHSHLQSLIEVAQKIGYPAGYVSKHWGSGHIGIERHYRVNRNVQFEYADK